MKNKVMLILIGILVTISIGLVVEVIYLKSNYVKVPKQYKCESEKEVAEDFTRQQILIVNITKEQYIESYQSKNMTTYTNNDRYEMTKNIEGNDDIVYSYDDKSKTIMSETKFQKMLDEEGNVMDVFYKNYINNLESLGYHCAIIK